MANKMLIDATHPEETRVVVLRGNRVEEFDFEAANRKQLRGNIYLAKVTRVEPSLQAAFVDYGGNRHGFLAFSEIHPDYYQIPVADRQALLEEERLRHSSEDDFEPADDEADFQEIDESDEDDSEDGPVEAATAEEETKPRKPRTSRSRNNRNKSPRGSRSAKTDADADTAPTDANGDNVASSEASGPEDAQSPENQAPENQAAENQAPETPTSVTEGSENQESSAVAQNGSDGEATSSSETTPDASGSSTQDKTSEDSQASDDGETPGKVIPDRFLSAADDDDAVISGDVPDDGGKTPKADLQASAEESTSEAQPDDGPADDGLADDGQANDDEADGGQTDDGLAQDTETEATTGAGDEPQAPDQEAAGEETADGSSAVDAANSDDAAGESVELSADQDSDNAPQSDTETSASEAEVVELEAVEDDAEEVQEDNSENGVVQKKRNQRNSDSAPSRPRRRYKIQEVIKRRQIILVQVVKEERGTKGAALTTYLSLAGRYSVLMPNSARGGGISRKITNPGDRKRLKQIANELPVPEGMGVILRTAGASRTKTEVKRDFEYLMRLWENVRDLTLQSSAPALVYEEGNLVKRSIRDLYNKDIDEVLVAGETGYREAKDFMRMLMPSHAKNVQPYKDQVPIFARNRVEPQLDAMFLPQVTLPSGGYIVINQTEALVAVDVNSGKATREHNIEDTALRTNVEAAEEMARQLRLRDLAGLIVIDFIDMEEKRNNRTVERKLKDCLKSDRARIQVGRISHFGLLEMSRQRLRTGVLESSTELCPHCHGTGVIRSTESVALYVLRSIEDQLLRSSSHNLNVRIRTEVALYIINNKRFSLTDMEDRYGISLNLVADETIQDSYCIIDKSGVAESRRTPPAQIPEIVQPDTIDPDETVDDEAEESGEQVAVDQEATEQPDDDGGPKKRRRKRRRRGRDSENGEKSDRTDESPSEGAAEAQPNAEADGDPESAEAQDEAAGKKRRRGRRGGRRNKRTDGETADQNSEAQADESENASADDKQQDNAEPTALNGAGEPEAGNIAAESETEVESGQSELQSAEDTAKPTEEVSETAAASTSEDNVTEALPSEPVTDTEDAKAPINGAESNGAEPMESQSNMSESASGDEEQAPEVPAAETVAAVEDDNRPKKSGWWQKRSFFK